MNLLSYYEMCQTLHYCYCNFFWLFEKLQFTQNVSEILIWHSEETKGFSSHALIFQDGKIQQPSKICMQGKTKQKTAAELFSRKNTCIRTVVNFSHCVDAVAVLAQRDIFVMFRIKLPKLQEKILKFDTSSNFLSNSVIQCSKHKHIQNRFFFSFWT